MEEKQDLSQDLKPARRNRGRKFYETMPATARHSMLARRVEEREARYISLRGLVQWAIVALIVLALLFMFAWDLDITRQSGPVIDLSPSL